MPQVLVRNIHESVMGMLKERAKENKRSLQGELRAILEEAAGINRSTKVEEFLIRAKAIRDRTAGKSQTDSADLIREDRER